MVVSAIKCLDLYSKPISDVTINTVPGALLTISSSLLIIALFISETNVYLLPLTRQEIFVDILRNENLTVTLDIILTNIPCEYISIDVQDKFNDQYPNVDKNIRKIDVHEEDMQLNAEDSNLISDKAKIDSICESCHIPSDLDKNNMCCPTCISVVKAFAKHQLLLPDLLGIPQCQPEQKSNSGADNRGQKGCKFIGYFTVKRVAGNFHFVPGKSDSTHEYHTHNPDPIFFKNVNLSHKINAISYGDEMPGYTNPLNKIAVIAPKTNVSYSYFTTIVSTAYAYSNETVSHSNRYSVSNILENGIKGFENHGLYFLFDFSVLMVKVSEEDRSLMEFLTNLCAILGGVFTVTGIIDKVIHWTLRYFKLHFSRSK